MSILRKRKVQLGCTRSQSGWRLENKWEALYKHHENHQENCFGTNSATALKVVHQLRATLIAIDVFQVLEIAAMKIPKMFATFFFQLTKMGEVP